MPVLVVDDNIVICVLIARILAKMELECEAVTSGEEAVKYLQEKQELPSIIMLDIDLPGIDGYQTATQLKAIAADRHLPIIFLTGKKEDNILCKCLEVGDDYIAKPFTMNVVSSKVKAHRRVSDLYSKMEQQYLELQDYQQRVVLEHEIVENIFSNHFKKHIFETDILRYYISPSSVFNGDVLLTAFGPSGNLYIAVGDVTGHGLPAAVGAIPVYNTFRTMATKGFSVGHIAAEMNTALCELLPDNMMLAASLLELNSAGDTLTIWSGGVPPIILADGEGNIKELIEPKHCPLAMLSKSEFTQEVQIYSVEPDDKVYLFTDGVEESRNSSGEMFGEDRLHSLFDGSGVDMFDRILKELEEFVGDGKQDDDITLIELICLPTNIDLAEKPKEDTNALPWTLVYDLGIEEIKQENALPQIIRMLSNAVGFDVHQDYLSTVISELLANAIDYGLLFLDSSMKHSGDGFMEYYGLRRTRLTELQQGHINIQLNFKQELNPVIDIRIKDSGPGFDYSNTFSPVSDTAYGRGIGILRELCDKLVYSERGSCVTATYSI